MLPEVFSFHIRLKPRKFFAAVFLSPLVVPVGMWVWSWPWGSVQAPAWVQAIGSIATLFIALWIVEIQNRQRRRAEIEGDNVQAKKLLAIADCIIPRVLNACGSRVAFDYLYESTTARFADDLKECSSLISRVDISHVPSAEITVEWLALACVVGRVRDTFITRGGEAGLFEIVVVTYPEQLKGAHAALRKAVEGFISPSG